MPDPFKRAFKFFVFLEILNRDLELFFPIYRPGLRNKELLSLKYIVVISVGIALSSYLPASKQYRDILELDKRKVGPWSLLL